MQQQPALEVKELSMSFSGIKAISSANLKVGVGEIKAVIGPNGAGKTTLFNCITGIYKPSSGSIFLNNKGNPAETTGLKAHQITQLGLARTFQNIRLFNRMSVLENVMIGFHCRTHSGITGAIFRFSRQRDEEKKIYHKSLEILSYLKLEKNFNQEARNLPYAAQRKLEIARALATSPNLLLLDEPAAGMNPQETLELREIIQKIRLDFQVTIILIEHDMRFVMQLSDSVVVMDQGTVIADDSPTKVSANPKVISAYLGEEDCLD
ncbi:MAG: ABC transporter ATP-binding protein [Oligoflexales bacterium]